MTLAYFYRDYHGDDSLGRPRAAKCMSRALARERVKVIVYCYTSDRRQEGCFDDHGVAVKVFYQPPVLHHRNFLHVPAGLKEILRCNRDRADAAILSGGFIPENYPVARLLVQAGLPYVFEPYEAFDPNTFRGAKRLVKGVYEHFFERDVVNHAAALRLISQSQERHFHTRGYDLAPDRCFVAKDGIDWELMHTESGYDETLRSSGYEHTDNLLFGFIGRLAIYQKGLDILLQAWAIYKREGGQGQLLVSGPDAGSRSRLKLQSMCRSLNLQDVDVQPPKYGREKFAFMQRISALVYPSRHEIIPRTLREALGIGCPLIVSEHTNLHDLVGEKQAGFVADLNPQDLAEKMHRIQLLAPAELAQMRRNARDAAASLDTGLIARGYLRDIRNTLNLSHWPEDTVFDKAVA